MTITKEISKIDKVNTLLSKINEEKNQSSIKDYINKLKFDLVYSALSLSKFRINAADVKLFLKKGKLSNKYTLNHYLMIKNYNTMVEKYLSENIIGFSKNLIKDLHIILTNGINEINDTENSEIIKIKQGKYRNDEIEKEIIELINWFNSKKNETDILDDLIGLYIKLSQMKAFSFGSEIISFTILNIMLVNAGFIPIVIQEENIDVYKRNLQEAKNGNFIYIKDFIVDNVLNGLNKYLGKDNLEIASIEELKRRLDEFYQCLKSDQENEEYADTKEIEEYEKININESIVNIREKISKITKEIFINKDNAHFKWDIKSPIRIDNLPIANSAIIVEHFDEKEIEITNTLIGTTYLDFLTQGGSVLINLSPHKKHIPKSSFSMCLLVSYNTIYLVGSISVAGIELGEERLVPNDNSRVFHIKGSSDSNKWSNKKVESFYIKCIIALINIIENEVENRKNIGYFI